MLKTTSENVAAMANRCVAIFDLGGAVIDGNLRYLSRKLGLAYTSSRINRSGTHCRLSPS